MHASMIALGVADEQKNRKVIINNQVHESVGAMPTGCMNTPIAEVARAVGYKYV